MLRKTRFVCVSDTHGYTPSEAGFKLSAGDVLIHAGDLTNNGSMKELRKTMDWISKADFEIKIIVGGNHDVTLDPTFYAEHGQKFHGQHTENPQRCLELVTGSSPSVVLLQHQSASVRLSHADGPNTIFKVFGSPYSQFQGSWAFGYDSATAAALWSSIPLDTDIVVTHTPPWSHCDQKSEGMSVGCDALRQSLSRIRPLLAFCGHVHEGRGYERVCWRTAAVGANAKADEADLVVRGILPPIGSKKQSLIDLTGKREERLDNDGFSFSTHGTNGMLTSACHESLAGVVPETTSQPVALSPVTHGMVHALHSHRKETCIVNAAVMATSWPHRGGKRFNAPIVVDLELPVWKYDHASYTSEPQRV